MSNVIKHYGMPRRSGRYPWGSGKDAYQRSLGWQGHVEKLRKEGYDDNKIAEMEGIKSTQFRARNTIAKIEVRESLRNQAIKLTDKGYTPTEIGRIMGKNESAIRSLLDPVIAERAAIVKNTANMLKEQVDKYRYIDIGTGVEHDPNIGVKRQTFNNAIAVLKEEGYKVHTVRVDQVGIPGQFTNQKFLGAPDTTWKEIYNNPSLAKNITSKTDDFGRTYKFDPDFDVSKIQYVNSKRVQVKYYETGGVDKDGVIELRRGVKDLDLGNSKYAQVRIGIDGTHFLKGMAIYTDEEMPAGVDIIFNSNKHEANGKMKAMKELKKTETGELDPDNPFGATIKRQHGALNIVNEEGDWEKWSKTISSQILSKQAVPLAKRQLALALKEKQEEFEEIMSLTNPVVKKQLLLAFADDADASAVHLKAAALPRQASKVILPLPNIKRTEVYAPTFNNGETVVLIRHPHGGTFEIPQLTVNNKSKSARAIMENARDAIGIHPDVAKKLSGADFDGDAVIVIPNNKGHIKTSDSLRQLKDFDPIEMYKPYDGMRTIDGGTWNAKTGKVDYPLKANGEPRKITRTKGIKMGEVSNLITDMTIKGANLDEIALAVKHSMVVIDSEKHHLDYARSFKENNIAALSLAYQGKKTGGASTLISRASSTKPVDERKPRSAKDGGPIDPATGMKVYTPTGKSYVNKKGKLIVFKTETTKMADTPDAFTLSSGRPIEEAYAVHANSLKSLANTARKNALATMPTPYSPSAKKVYEKEVASLDSKLRIAEMGKPLERDAQRIANSTIDRIKQTRGDMDDDDLKKVRNQALANARARTGAKKTRIGTKDSPLTDREWEAIQAGAISPSKLTKILQNSDLDRIKALATPRERVSLSVTKIDRARLMLESGNTLSEVADNLGVTTSALSRALYGN